MEHLPNVAYMILRISYSIVFLNAAWQCGKSKAGIRWTIEESRILFGNTAPLFGVAGIFVMGFGGLSVLLGIYPEIGGVMLGLFVLPGAIIHHRKQKEAQVLGDELGAPGDEKTQVLTTLALLGHYSSAMKNYSLCGPGLFLALTGGGAWVVALLWT